MKDPVELDALARQVIAEGRNAFEPTALVCARVRRSVDGKLAAGASVPALHAAHSAPGWVKYMVGSTVASVVTAAFAYAVWRPKLAISPRTVPQPAAANPVSAEPSAPTAITEKTKPSLPVPQQSASEPAGSRAVPTTSAKTDSLAEEVKLLASVNSAIQSHDAVQALRLLRTYDRQFKNPVLREERAAAGVLALCAAGRVDAARAAGERFQSAWPHSPLTARVVNSCISGR